jgi:hypothetical protein
MKKIAFITMAAFLLFAACKKEPTPEPQPQPGTTTNISLAGTSWVGTYDDNYRGYPATLTWSIDFLTDSTGTLHLDIVIAASPQPSVDDNFTYTFDGREICTYGSENMGDSSLFTYDSTTHTISTNMFVGDGNVTLGGYTVLYPEGQEQYVFPVRTSWEAEQQLTVSDTLMPVDWGLDFWEYGWGGQINYCAGSTCAGTSFLWQYDSTTHSGSIRINGMQHPFTYNPATSLLTLDYSTPLYGTSITIGGSLQFHREDDLKKTYGLSHTGPTVPIMQTSFHLL